MIGIGRKSLLLTVMLLCLGSRPMPERTLVATPAGWHQEGHDAQHSGYSPGDLPTPWTYKWQWNGSCSNPVGSDCRPGDPELGWTFPLPGKSHLVAGAGRLYLPAGDQGVWAISEADGKTAWHSSAILSYCSAAFDPDSDTLFVAAREGRLYKLDPATGTTLGSYQAGSALNLAPIIAAGRVFVVADSGTLYAINKETMTLAWSYSAGSTAQTQAAYSAQQDVLVFGTEDLYVHAVSNTDGSRRWRVKPTVNLPGDLSYDGGDGAMHHTYNYEYGWPVIAEVHGIVFMRLHQPWSSVYDVPRPPNWFPTTNAAIRSFLISRPELQTLFALRLSDGSSAFVPAVGNSAPETNSSYLTLGALPVVKQLSSGAEVVYTPWRNGQKCEEGDCIDPRGDTVMGEMVLDAATVPGYQAGDLRFVQFENASDFLITDETDKLVMAGDILWHPHWLYNTAYRITDRGDTLGSHYTNPIATQKQRSLIYAAADPSSSYQADPSHYSSGALQTYGDTRLQGDTFWAYFGVAQPGRTDGYTPRYTITNNGSIYYQLHSGGIFAVRSAAAPVGPTRTPTRMATATSIPPTATVRPSSTPLPPTTTAQPTATPLRTTTPWPTGTPAAQPPSGNLIANGTFEGGTLAGWEGSSAMASTTESHSGDWSARLDSGNIRARIKTVPGQLYCLRAWAKIASETGNDWGGGRMEVNSFSWVRLSGTKFLTASSQGRDWFRTILAFRATTDETFVDIGYFGGPSRDMLIYADDIEVIPWSGVTILPLIVK